MNQHPKIVVVGAGAIGASFGAWVSKSYDNLYFYARGESARVLRENGITIFHGDSPSVRETVPVRVLDRLSDGADADAVILAVKNYSLEAAAKEVFDVFGDRALVLGMQNGTQNQTILPRYFTKCVYCVVGYNAWLEAPGVVGYQKRGPLTLGTTDNSLQEELGILAEIFNRGLPTQVTDRLRDAVYTKLVINLANSLTTLTGFRVAPMSERGLKLFQKLFVRLLLEGVKTVRAAGVREFINEGTPSWAKLRLMGCLPGPIARKLFSASTSKFFMSSMAQDIIQRGGHLSELESLNGAVLSLAREQGVKTPVNRTVYELCKTAFAKEPFVPMDAETLWREIRRGKGI